MQQIFAILKQAFRQSLLIMGLISLVSVTCLSLFATQPSLAATPNQKLMQQEAMDRASQEDVSAREQAYEEQIQAAENPEKVYEENVKGTGEGIVEKAVDSAKEAVSKVTGND